MAIEVFNRYEKKFIITDDIYQRLQDVIHEHMETDKHNLDGNTYTISNIYYDTDDNAVIRRSIEKPKYKEKLRLRSYGVTPLDGKVFFEIKKKVNGLVNKRRTKLTLEEAYKFAETGNPPPLQDYMNPQVLKEITFYLEHHPVVPKTYLAYDRFAFFEKGNNDLRVSFDRNIRTRRTDLGLHIGDYGDPLLDHDMWILEIKTSKAIPLWLTKALSEHGIYTRSFSKYGTEYLKYVENEMEDKQECMNYYSVEGLNRRLRSAPQC